MIKETYPDPICQDCGEHCERSEEIIPGGESEPGYSYIELWCYCPQCDRETNHPIPANENYPEL